MWRGPTRQLLQMRLPRGTFLSSHPLSMVTQRCKILYYLYREGSGGSCILRTQALPLCVCCLVACRTERDRFFQVKWARGIAILDLGTSSHLDERGVLLFGGSGGEGRLYWKASGSSTVGTARNFVDRVVFFVGKDDHEYFDDTWFLVLGE